MVRKFSSTAVVICVLAAAFYMYEFTLQVSLGVMTNELMHDLGLHAAGLGLVSAFYYYAYTPMQIPAGFLHDKFGPRYILTAAILICAVGAMFFSMSTGIVDSSLGRFFMGIGSAFPFSGALLLIARWFCPSYFAVLSGVVQLMSSVGAIGGELPLAIAIQHWGWRASTMYLAFFGIFLAAVVFLVVRDAPSDAAAPLPSAAHPSKHPSIPNKFKIVFGRSSAWWTAAYSFLIWAPIATFAGLWGVPFLVNAYNLTTKSASVACAMIWVGVGLGSPLTGWISEYIGRRCIILTSCSFVGLIASLDVIYRIFPSTLYLSLFALGYAGGAQSLAFCVVRDQSHPSSIGAAIGLNNMATVAGGAIIQPLVGYLLYLNWDGHYTAAHLPFYNVSNYQIGLTMIPVCYLLAIFISKFAMKETFCKQQFKF